MKYTVLILFFSFILVKAGMTQAESTAYNIDRLYGEKKWDCLQTILTNYKNKIDAAVALNSISLRLISPGTSNNLENRLQVATTFARKSIEIITAYILKKGCNANNTNQALDSECGMLRNSMVAIYDNFAGILYKNGKLDSAYYYITLANETDQIPLIKEHYAIYTKAFKGSKFIKPYVEKNLIAGNAYQVYSLLLKNIYDDLKLPKDSFTRFIATANDSLRERLKIKIKKDAMSLKAPDFILNDGNIGRIQLSKLLNKTVVLDFWATWCIPCLNSFPTMQNLVNNYRSDTNIVFLFINTREKMKPYNIKESILAFMEGRKVKLPVVIDIGNKISELYRVNQLPIRFVIDRYGIIRYRTIGFDGNERELYEEVKLILETIQR